MVRTQTVFRSRDGKTPIHAVEWRPEGPVNAVLQISHGVCEYILRYEPLARYLTDRGFAVVGNDHIGHGSSVAEGAPRLYFGPPGSWNAVVDDLYLLRGFAGRNFPGVPHFLLGHSMGSFLVRTYLIRYPGTVRGAILMGTGQTPPALLAGGKLLVARSGRKNGWTRPDPAVEQLVFGAYNQRFAPSRTPYDWLSVNRENVDAYAADPLCGGQATVGLFRELLEGIAFNQQPRNLRRMNLDTPVLFVSGAMDPVGDFGRGVQRACRSFRKAGMRDVAQKLYPQLRHEILNESCRDLVFQDLWQWMARKGGLYLSQTAPDRPI